MSLPPTFRTQSLGELVLQTEEQSYRPSNQNAYRFLFQPNKNPNPPSWITLIDQRVPQLNSQWPSILASSADQLKAALSEAGEETLTDEARLQHITLNGEGEAILLIALKESEAALSLQVELDTKGLVRTICLTR